MVKRLSLVLASLFAFVGMALAQVQVSGVVTDSEFGETVIGAHVQVKGTNETYTTDVDGRFSFTTRHKNPYITVTYVGMEPQTLPAKKGMTIVLNPKDAQKLQEVVVSGMQIIDKRLSTGATSKVDASKAMLDGVADITRSLEGRAAGVSVQNVSGTFGTAPKIRVRGATSIYGSSSPLWVIDGVIMEDAVKMDADDLSSGDATTLIANAIAGLNADDIESFQILKDGSATSIYGARAMAGVILVTTKKGRAGQSHVNYTGEFTYRRKPSYGEYNICNSQEQMGIYKEMAAKGWLEMSSLANSNTSGLYGQMYTLMDKYDATSGQFGLPNTQAAMNAYLQQAEFRNTDWFDLLFNNNIMQNHSVSISSGTERANVYASLSAMLDPGWTKDSKVSRYTANVNASYELIPKQLTLTMRTNASYRKQKAPGTLARDADVVSGAVNRNFDINPFSYALNTARTLDPYATYTRNYAPFNIFDELNNNYIDVNVMDVKFQGELNWKTPVKGLEFEALGSYRVNSSDREHDILNHSNQAEAYRAGVDNPNIMYGNTYLYTDPDKPNSLPVSVMPTGGIYVLNRDKVSQLDFRATGRYSKYWNNDTHIFNALVGFEANRADYESNMQSAYGVDFENSRLQTLTPDFYKQAKEEGTDLNTFAKSWNRRMAYFANVAYSYKGRYAVNFTGRYDGSNQYGKARKNRWLPTWNASGSWTLSNESWFQKFQERHKNWFSMAAIRASYSLVGESPYNSSLSVNPIFRALNVWRPQGDQQETGIALYNLGNSELTYEKKHEFNLGIDLGFIDNRINLVTDIYWRDNFDLLGMINTPGCGGETRKLANVASMKSHGVEATLTTKNIISRHWDWTTDLTFAYNYTEITKLLSRNNVLDLCYAGGAARVGYDHRALFSIPFVGLSDTGIPQVINQDGNVSYADLDFQEVDNLGFLKYEGPIDPTVTGGFNNTVTWKMGEKRGNLRLNVFLTYNFGNKIRLDNVFSSSYSDMSAMSKEFKNRWVMPGDERVTTIPTIASARQATDDYYISYAYNAYNYSTERVASGSFIRLKNISLTYDFAAALLKHAGIQTASIKLDATNLCLLYRDKKLNGQDPEFVNAGGVASPLSKQFTLTLRLGM